MGQSWFPPPGQSRNWLESILTTAFERRKINQGLDFFESPDVRLGHGTFHCSVTEADCFGALRVAVASSVRLRQRRVGSANENRRTQPGVSGRLHLMQRIKASHRLWRQGADAKFKPCGIPTGERKKFESSFSSFVSISQIKLGRWASSSKTVVRPVPFGWNRRLTVFD